MSLSAAHTFALFRRESSLFHGCFHRHGGSSPPPFASLNVSFGVGDEPANVRANRLLIKEWLDCEILISSRQVHAKEVAVVADVACDQELVGYDALITDQPGLGLLIQQADCQAIMLHDPVRQVVANIHCGWRGSALNIIATTISRMVETFACHPADLKAAISPALGPCCAEFRNYNTELPPALHGFQVRPDYFDFPAISAGQLQEAGLLPENIEPATICTRCNDSWFSYRRDRQTGRFCSIIGIRP
ncbi:MAG: copper oxidase [Desulfobulbaceae bacterium]|nr:MAG: copper oxidase [Desulfobulbaceae bacterium]